VLTFLIPVSQADKQISPLADIAIYEGADRQQRLIDGARREGELSLYASSPLENIKVIADAFEKEQGVKVKIWRASSEGVLQRIVNEARGGRFEFDVVDNNGPEMEALHREKLLQRVKSPYQKDLIPEALPSHGEWAGTYVNVFVQAYNTAKVKKEELPKTYRDLLDSKWKGRLGIEAEDLDWYSAIVKEFGEEEGIKLFRGIAATNGLSVRKGHTLLANLVASGEVPLALTVYSYMAEKLKQKGAPIDWFAMSPVIARTNGSGVSKRAPHPYAALLFYDFLIDKGQDLLVKMNYVPTSKRAQSPLKNVSLKLVDPAAILDEVDKWTKLYGDLTLRQGTISKEQ
jgi:iron(III) transport system substrate-binding protein